MLSAGQPDPGRSSTNRRGDQLYWHLKMLLAFKECVPERVAVSAHILFDVRTLLLGL